MLEESGILIERMGKKQLHFLFRMKDGRRLRHGLPEWRVFMAYCVTRLIFV